MRRRKSVGRTKTLSVSTVEISSKFKTLCDDFKVKNDLIIIQRDDEVSIQTEELAAFSEYFKYSS